MKFAAIDIGSNAIRLLFSIVSDAKGTVKYHKVSLIRMPVRLGSDSFLRGEISKARRDDLIKTMIAYRNLIEVFGVEDYMACATSALREAKNGPEIVEQIREEAGIELNLISGNFEAELIYSTHIAESLDKDKSYLYIDVGGGSTELTLFSHGERHEWASFKIGTIRLMEDLVEKVEWERLEEWINTHALKYAPLIGIGTGGNINKLFKLSGKKEGTPLHLTTLNKYYKYLSSFSYEERINELGMRPDRADVILPALTIYSNVIKMAGIHDLYVPKVGLVDGMVQLMYEKYKEKVS